MHISCMQENKVIGIPQSFEMADCPFNPLVGGHTIARDKQPVIAACNVVVDTGSVPQEICRLIAEIPHAIREGDVCRV